MAEQTADLPPILNHFFEGLVEILGKQDAETFLSSQQTQNNDPQTRGILIKAGRAGFYYWLRQNLDASGWNDPLFRLRPVKKKIASGLKDICLNLGSGTKQHMTLEDTQNTWQINLDHSPNALPCSYIWGFVQEYTRWAGNGRFYEVREHSCHLNGYSQCKLVIKKEPQD